MAQWRRWPHISMSHDQGSDGLSGIQCLKYRPQLRLHITEWWDESHGPGNDTLNCWKDHALYSFIMVTMIVMNLFHVPAKEPDIRFGQMNKGLLFLVQNFTHDSLGSLQAYVATMLWELRGVIDTSKHSMPIDALWEHICDKAGFPKHGRIVNDARLMAWLRGAKHLLQHWTLLLWLLEHLVLKMDMVGTQKFQTLALQSKDVQYSEVML